MRKYESIVVFSPELNKGQLSEQISKVKEILTKIATTNPDGDLIKEFRMKPVDPCHKISEDNYLLLKNIKNDNEVFFWYIKDCISQLDANKSSFDIIATEIKTAFLTPKTLAISTL